MQLAEALIRRKELQTKISRIRERLLNNALIQEGTTPTEDPVELLKQLDDSCSQLSILIAKINKTNMETVIDGTPLSELIVKRDMLIKRASIMREFLNRASDKVDRYSQKEILIKSTVDVVFYQKVVDQISHDARLLDAKIQYTNWNIEID